MFGTYLSENTSDHRTGPDLTGPDQSTLRSDGPMLFWNRTGASVISVSLDSSFELFFDLFVGYNPFDKLLPRILLFIFQSASMLQRVAVRFFNHTKLTITCEILNAACFILTKQHCFTTLKFNSLITSRCWLRLE
jgi:hypothetical protein